MKILKKIFFSLAALSIFIILIEIVLSYVFPIKTLDYDIGISSRNQTFSSLYALDRDLIWKFRKNTISASLNINSSGFRGKEFYPKREGEYRIICVGDDTVLGSAFTENFTFPFVLETILNDTLKDTGIEVYNAGIEGYSTYQASILAERLIAYKPDLIVLVTGLNDVRVSPITDEQRVRRHYIEKARRFLYNFHFYGIGKLMITRLHHTAYELFADDPPLFDTDQKRVSGKQFAEYIGELDKKLKKSGLGLIFVPDSFEDENYFGFQLKKAAELGIETLDLNKELRTAAKRFSERLAVELKLASDAGGDTSKKAVRCLYPGKNNPGRLYMPYEYVRESRPHDERNTTGKGRLARFHYGIMKDDGVYPDEHPGDSVFTAFLPIKPGVEFHFHFLDEPLDSIRGYVSEYTYIAHTPEDILPLYVYDFDYLFMRDACLNEKGLRIVAEGVAGMVVGKRAR